MTTRFPNKGSDDLFKPFCLDQPPKQKRLPITYKGPLILLIVFVLFLIPLLPRENVNPEMFLGVETRSYRPFSLIQTMDGGFALGGEVDLYGGQGGFALGGKFVTDMWLMKTDETGVALWNQTYGGADCETASTLVQTTDGGFALAGATSSYSAEGYMDMWLVKTDANGLAQWNQTYGEPGWDEASSLVQTADGGFALAGWFNRFCTGGDDMCLVKTDANGVTQWNQTYGDIDRYGTTALVQTTDGGFALASSTNSSGAGKYDMWLVKTNENGLALWNQTYGGGYLDGATTLVQTADGGFALSGYTNVSNLLSYILNQAFSDIGLVKTDENGVTQWNQTYGGLGWEDASALVQTVDGGFALSGSTRSFGACFTNMWLVKTDAIGVPQWNQTYGGLPWSPTSYDNWDTLLVQTMDGGFALTGNTRSSGAGSSSNILLVKIDANGIVQWNQTYGGANPEARITTGQGTLGQGTLALITALIVLIASERIKQGKKRRRN